MWDSPRMSHVVVNAARPETREQRAWYWYDWANSAYVTTTATVLMSPVPHDRRRGGRLSGPARRRSDCTTNLSVLGIPVAPGSLWFFTVTFTTILSAIVLIFVGAIADRSPRPTRLLAGFAWAGALAASLMFFVAGTNWQLGVAARRRRQHLPRRLARHLRLDPVPHRQRERARPRLLEGLGVRLPRRRHPARAQLRPRLLPRGPRARPGDVDAHQHPVGRPLVGRFTLIPYLGLRHLDRHRRDAGRAARPGSCGGSFAQLRSTFHDLANYPQTKLFLLAYLFFNDGIQTVIGSSSLYGSRSSASPSRRCSASSSSCSSSPSSGAALRPGGRPRSAPGAPSSTASASGRSSSSSPSSCPSKSLVIFLALGLLIGLVLGGTQALSRSLYSQLIPRGREAEYFSLYQAMERGTSWFGTLIFGLVYQFTLSYRWAIIALIVFFVIGGVLLSRVRHARGHRAGRQPGPRRHLRPAYNPRRAGNN